MAKNPEQNNNQDQGPPDLDELLNDLGKKISRLFGRKESTQKNSKPNNGGSQSEVPQDQLPVTTIVLIIP